MNRTLLCIFCISILSLSCSKKSIKSNASEGLNNRSELDSLSLNNYIFPDDWLGNWSGDLGIYNSQGLKQTIPMALELSKTDTIGKFNWCISK